MAVIERKQRNMDKNKGKTTDYSFQVDLKGLIRLLSENLYSSNDVFLREFLQNCVAESRKKRRRCAARESHPVWL